VVLNLPNIITLARGLLIPVFILFFYIDLPAAPYIALGVFIVAGATDWLDGYLARRYNKVTTLGKFIDPLADKLLVVSACVMLAASGLMHPVAVIIVTARELVVTTLRVVAMSKGVVLAADKSGKIKTAVQIVCIALMLAPFVAEVSFALFGIDIALTLALAVITAAVTLWSGADYMIKNAYLFKEQE